MLRPLKLKVQQVPAPLGPIATTAPLAIVWVDSGIPNLSEPFTYLIPAKMSAAIAVGVRVQVPFRDRQVEGLVLNRCEDDGSRGNLKQIQRVLGEIPVATSETITLIAQVAKYWGGTPFDVIRSAIPPRVATAEKDLKINFSLDSSSQQSETCFQLLPPRQDPIAALIELVLASKVSGTKLVLVPTQRDLDRLQLQLSKLEQPFVSLDSSAPRAMRYRNFLLSIDSATELVIGMRGAVFAPIANLAEVFIHQEDSEHYFERRAPYWNARDVAIMRAQSQALRLVLTGYLPSPSVTYLIESKAVIFKAVRERIKVVAQPSSNGELIPTKIFKEIRAALKLGPVLFLVPAKGYATAISCAKCRNLALCECGGKLIKISAQDAPQCTLCQKVFTNWKCGWCNEARIFLLSRGIERFSEEIGKSFPNIKVIQSTSTLSVSEVADEPTLVIATAGVEPLSRNGYRAVVILQVDRFLSSSSITGQQKAFANFFAAVALARDEAIIAMVCEDGSAITSAISTWNPATIAKRQNEDNRDLNLPPTSLAILLNGDLTELARLKVALSKAIAEGRAPQSMRIFGPADMAEKLGKLTLLVDPSAHEKTVALILEVNHRRSLSKKELFKIQVKPYSID